MDAGLKQTALMEIAGIGFSQSCEPGWFIKEPGPVYAPFYAQGAALENQVDVRFVRDKACPADKAEFLFDSGVSWSLFKTGPGFRIVLKGGEKDNPLWTADTNPDFSRVRVFPGQESLDGEKNAIQPLGYPLDQILMMHILARRGGVILHAAGVLANERAYLFTGRSGAGKSTISRLLSQERGLTVLGDDRIALTGTSNMPKGQWTAHGTPWPGEGGMAIREKAPLAGIFFLEHAKVNQVLPIEPSEALKRLLPVASVPWYMATDMALALETCGRLSERVPVYVLRFKKDKGAQDALGPFFAAKDKAQPDLRTEEHGAPNSLV